MVLRLGGSLAIPSLALPLGCRLFARWECAVGQIEDVVARVVSVDPKAHIESVDIDHRHGLVANLKNIAHRQFEFAELLWQLVPPCRRNRRPQRSVLNDAASGI